MFRPFHGGHQEGWVLRYGLPGPQSAPKATSQKGKGPGARGKGNDVVKASSKPIQPRIFDHLVAIGRLTQADLDQALAEALKGPLDLETLLLDKYRIPKADLGKALAEHYRCPFIEFDDRAVPDPTLLNNLNVDYLKKHHWVPIRREKNTLDVLVDDPQDLDKGLDIKRAFPGLTIRFAVALRRDIDQYLLTGAGERDRGSLDELLGQLASEADTEPLDQEVSADNVDENHNAIVRLANQIIAQAYRIGASDIHIEPYSHRKETAIRFRVDGTCATYMRIPPTYRRPIVSRLKILANLDIAERRKPQDGKILFKLDHDRDIELRVVTLPTAGGNEDVVLRILTAKLPMRLEQMGFSERDLTSIKGIAERPYGIILCVGPTGSGKTTTLHALLGEINTDERKIWTAEDPIEITQDGLRQVQVQPKIGLTFAAALRSFLRADPDVIMIGEMRDKETAETAIAASLTGHLVLSTLHTNSAVETITRLLDLGCDPFSFADAMLGIMAKRLCKKICEKCKEPYHPAEKEYEEMVQAYGVDYWARLNIQYDDSFTLYRGRGCTECNDTGFRGRIALHELLLGSEEMRSLIQSKAKTWELRRLALEEGMTTLNQDGIQKVLAGQTTLKQVRSVTMK